VIVTVEGDPVIGKGPRLGFADVVKERGEASHEIGRALGELFGRRLAGADLLHHGVGVGQHIFVLVDGILPLRCWSGLQRCVVRGDSHSPAIAAASVIAKVARDALIGRLAERYPGYGLERHAGYGTALHRVALGQLGLTPLHRRTFLRKLLAAQPSG
jgi:ribonuclease HII